MVQCNCIQIRHIIVNPSLPRPIAQARGELALGPVNKIKEAHPKYFVFLVSVQVRTTNMLSALPVH